MKNLFGIISVLALAGVIALFGMKMTEKKIKTPTPIITKDSTGKEVVLSGTRIAYVDIDTLEANYNYFKKKKNEFESRQKAIDADLEKMANALQNEYAGLQKKAQDGKLSQAEGDVAQQRLMQRQQELELKRQNLGTKYLKDQEDFNKEIHDNLHKYIEIYNEEHGYDYILSYSKDGSILFANKYMDITQDIIEGMNSGKGLEKNKFKRLKMRKKIVAGNWKMNTSIKEGIDLMNQIVHEMPNLKEHQQVIFCAPFTHLYSLSNQNKKSNVMLGAQNCNDKVSGAYTGEISIPMLQEIGVEAVIIGHSERRQYFEENNIFLKSKVNALIEAKLQILFCCGESLEIRQADGQNDFVSQQLEESVFHLSAEELKNHVVIAYEPIWAIGTGVTASTEQAQEMHAHIRSLLISKYGEEIASQISILYGGSCNASNAKELFSCNDVDGGLIGGAALKPETFLPIIEALA